MKPQSEFDYLYKGLELLRQMLQEIKVLIEQLAADLSQDSDEEPPETN